ncbi:hypothetical protein [Fundidesulfovibrio terrae]|uniref:hypothetical protein n=1 Tax=Fundidesulfovibrio terrae TaxID=2922866 RepID=UPI001FAFF0A7|nr:hypothetical protein [Fundidesulfovibrio terrae]
MPDKLLTAREVQTLLSLVSPRAASALMDEWGLPFIHLGLGRGRGRRWWRSVVLAAIKERERGAPKARPRLPKPDKQDDFWSLSTAEAYERIHGKSLKAALAE